MSEDGRQNKLKQDGALCVAPLNSSFTISGSTPGAGVGDDNRLRPISAYPYSELYIHTYLAVTVRPGLNRHSSMKLSPASVAYSGIKGLVNTGTLTVRHPVYNTR
jgi:hypothetical protein